MVVGGRITTICPRERAEQVAPLVLAWRWLAEHGRLPVAGGWLDQTEGFVEACAVLDAERSAIIAAQQERMKRGTP